jgi:hypothetical protein
VIQKLVFVKRSLLKTSGVFLHFYNENLKRRSEKGREKVRGGRYEED